MNIAGRSIPNGSFPEMYSSNPVVSTALLLLDASEGMGELKVQGVLNPLYCTEPTGVVELEIPCTRLFVHLRYFCFKKPDFMAKSIELSHLCDNCRQISTP